MTAEDRVGAVAEFGFTPRQARFLTMVMRHAGVCLLRQYSTFAGIVHGQKTRAFFRKLVSRRFASTYACRHNRGHLYHVHHYGLYDAIGEPNSPHRRPMGAGRIVERLMLLDSVLADPELNWLATRAEKVAHFATTPRIASVEGPPRSNGDLRAAERARAVVILATGEGAAQRAFGGIVVQRDAGIVQEEGSGLRDDHKVLRVRVLLLSGKYCPRGPCVCPPDNAHDLKITHWRTEIRKGPGDILPGLFLFALVLWKPRNKSR